MSAAGFTLDRRLREDTVALGRLDLCRVLLMDERRWPWVILVPERADVAELWELQPVDRAALVEESALVGERLARAFSADKLNVAMLGNRVRQLHVHHVVRHEGDPFWPDPVWGHGREPLPEAERAERTAAVRAALGVGD